MRRYSSFLEMLKNQKKDSIALSFADGDSLKHLTYSELILKINETPVSKCESVGIICENNLQTILAIFANAQAKKQVVLLNPKDPLDVLTNQIKSADIEELVGNEELVNQLSSSISFKNKEVIHGSIIFFTSGTTSSNKGVVLTEESLCASAYNGSACLPLNENDTLLSLLPLSHVFGFVCSLLWGLSCGANVALTRGVRHLFDDGSFFEATVISLVPQIATFMAMNKMFNPSLRLVLIGAGPCPKNILNLIKSQGIQVSFGYGLTETSSGVALSIGEDPEAMTICPDDKVSIAPDGEILLDAPTCIMKGYYKNKDATNEVLIDNVLHTGDLGRIDENGLLHVTGRKKDILVLNNGTKIFCPEYENELKQYLPKNDFAITLIDDLLYLFVQGNNSKEIEESIKTFNLSKPHGQRIAKIKYVTNDLPRTQTGKIKRWALANLI